MDDPWVRLSCEIIGIDISIVLGFYAPIIHLFRVL